MRWIPLFILLIHCLLISAQFDSIYTIASSWSMWSAWSACAPEGVMIRVRACSTVRGFKCVGRNKEFKSCEQKNSNDDTDFDQIDEDRQMAIKQLYQDYDLHANAAAVPKKPSGLQYLQQNHQILPPGQNTMVIAPPGHARTMSPPMLREETIFKGSFKSTEEEKTSSFPMQSGLTTPHTSHWANSGEELMEEDADEGSQTTPLLPSTQSQKRRYKAKYVTQGPVVMLESSTTTTTTTTEEEKVEVTDNEDQNPQQNKPLPDFVNPSNELANNEEELSIVSVLPETTSTTETTTSSITTVTTAETTTISETTPQSFPIQQEIIPEKQITSQNQLKPKIHGRTRVQQLPIVFGMNTQAAPFGMLPPISPPRAVERILHNGQIDDTVALKEGRHRLRKLRKNRRRKPTSKTAEQLVTGDTALALSWLIANMTQSIGDVSLPLSDRIILEKYIPKEANNQSEFKWSQWSLWSECRCGLQRRKRICLPSSHELLQDGSRCPLPEFEERICISDYCQ